MLNAGIVEVYQDSSNLQTCTRYTTCSDVLSGERLGFFDGSWLSRHSSDHNRALCWGSTCRGALQLDKNSARVQVTCHHTNAFVLFSAPTSASRGPSCLGRRDQMSAYWRRYLHGPGQGTEAHNFTVEPSRRPVATRRRILESEQSRVLEVNNTRYVRPRL